MATKNAIEVRQFAEHLRRAWSGAKGSLPYGRPGFVPGIPRRVGLAISGGADSMALAYLCRELEKARLGGPFSVTAFIVDHRARPESTDEAYTVKNWLTKLGIKTEILTLDWAQLSNSHQQLQDKSPEKPTAFETYARRLRFQTLGKACYQGGIEAMLLGHHQDDTVETVMWRLAMRSPLPGLNGIHSIVRIPECHGIFGVSESGSAVTLPNFSGLASKTQIASGGIYLCRPLLDFPKSQLLATCHANNVPYVSDPTNFDPTLTPRNSIRDIISKDSFPRALQAPRILSLMKSSRYLVTSANELSDKILSSQCSIQDVDLPAGTITIEFNYSQSTMEKLLEHASPEKLEQVQCLTLRRITDLVSPMPYNNFPPNKFEPFVSKLFGSVDQDGYKMTYVAPRPFTVGGAMFTPVESENSRSEKRLESKARKGGKISRAWRLSRRPYSKREVAIGSTSIEVPLPRLENSAWKPGQSEWVLWDNRYWFRVTLTVKNKDTKMPKSMETETMSFEIRPFGNKDYLAMVDDARTGYQKRRTLNELRDMFADRAPEKIRFTVPTLANEGPSETSQGRSLVLPTLDFVTSKGTYQKRVEIMHNGVPMVLTWSWMFKMVDTDVLRLMGRPVQAGTASVQ